MTLNGWKSDYKKAVLLDAYDINGNAEKDIIRGTNGRTESP